MNKENKSSYPILEMIFALILSVGITFFNSNNVFSKTKTPIEAYKVYLKGDVIGLIKSDKELYDYINKMQDQLMKKYNVNNVYIPNDIKVEKDITYESNISTVANIYNIINEKSPFTIKGYKVIIDETNSTSYDNETNQDAETIPETDKITTINVLDKDIFKEAEKKVILSFVSEQDFNDYSNDIKKTNINKGKVKEK